MLSRPNSRTHPADSIGGCSPLLALLVFPFLGCTGTPSYPPGEFAIPKCAPEVDSISGAAVDVDFPGYKDWYTSAQPEHYILDLTWIDGRAFVGLEAVDVAVVIPVDPTVFSATFAEPSGCAPMHYAVDQVLLTAPPDRAPWLGDSWVNFDRGEVVRWRASVPSPPLDGTSLEGRWRELLADAGLLVLSQAPTMVFQLDGTRTSGSISVFAMPAGDEGHQVPFEVAHGTYGVQ